MTYFRLAYSVILVGMVASLLLLHGWNKGWDLGYPAGYTKAILDGRMEIDCKFQANCQKDYDRGFIQGLSESGNSCPLPKKGETYEPTPITR